MKVELRLTHVQLDSLLSVISSTINLHSSTRPESPKWLESTIDDLREVERQLELHIEQSDPDEE